MKIGNFKIATYDVGGFLDTNDTLDRFEYKILF